jgi:hypothetical protein
MIDIEMGLDIVTFILAVVALFLLLWVYEISRRDMLHSFAVITLITVFVFAGGKFLDALNLGFFGTKIFSNMVELILMLGLVTAILSFYQKWSQADQPPR